MVLGIAIAIAVAGSGFIALLLLTQIAVLPIVWPLTLGVTFGPLLLALAGRALLRRRR